MDSAIAQAHANCVSIFYILIGALHSSCCLEDQAEGRDAFDRYKLWAGNVGAIHSGIKYNLSLDYRLREASFYKDQVFGDLNNRVNRDLRSFRY